MKNQWMIAWTNTPQLAEQRRRIEGSEKMSSVPYPYQQQQPIIPLVVYPNAAANNNNGGSGEGHSHGSVGPVLVVLSIIAILAVLSCVAGRICAGRLFSANSRYDCVGWMERRCAPCIDGDIEGFEANHVPLAKVTSDETTEPKPDDPPPPPA